MSRNSGFSGRSSGLNIAAVFVLAVMFLLIALSVVSMGVSVYGKTVEESQRNYDTRTALSYIANQARLYDADGGVREARIGGVAALALTRNINGIRWTSYIYHYDGFVREITMAREGAVVSLDSGRRIIEAEGMEVELADELIVINVIFEQKTERLIISPECGEVAR